MLIPETYLARLRSAGLLISDPFVPTHVAYPDGVIVGKPVKAFGNTVPGLERGWGLDGPSLDAPAVEFHYDAARDKWVVTSWDYIPGPGPGDFVNEWRSGDEAVADILDFYFGDPLRMSLKG